jgi:hypothetical protein
MMLQAGQLLSNLGTQVASIAYPLLVLAMTGSAAEAGFTASMLPSALAMPSTDAVVHGYRIAMTPDRLLGRVESAWSTFALLMAPFGPLLAGVLIADVSARAAIGVFAGVAFVLALWGTLSPSLRTAPSLDRLAAEAASAP